MFDAARKVYYQKTTFEVINDSQLRLFSWSVETSWKVFSSGGREEQPAKCQPD